MLNSKAEVPDLARLNAMRPADFVEALDGIFEHAAWVAEEAAPGRPYSDLAALHAGLMQVVLSAPEAQRETFLNGHPELTAGALAPDLTAASHAEQSGIPLGSVIPADVLATMLHDYRARFGIPFIVALRRRTPEAVIRELAERLRGDRSSERTTALAEVGHVSRLRLLDRFRCPALPRGTVALSVRLEELPGSALRAVLLQEGRPVWNGELVHRATEMILAGPELRIGHYAVAVEGWADDALPRGAALRFAVRDPDARIGIIVRAAASSVTVRLISPPVAVQAELPVRPPEG